MEETMNNTAIIEETANAVANAGKTSGGHAGLIGLACFGAVALGATVGSLIVHKIHKKKEAAKAAEESQTDDDVQESDPEDSTEK